MENWTLENFELVTEAMLTIAYNFWPCILLFVGYAVWEALSDLTNSKSEGIQQDLSGT